MKLLITGGAGFIGRALLARLPDDVDVVVVDSLDEQTHTHGRVFPPDVTDRAECVVADLRETERYAAAAEGADVVVHLAALTGTGQSMYEISRYVQHNVDCTARLLELLHALQRRPGRFILASSRAVYGEGAFGDPQFPVVSPGRRTEDLEAGRWGVCDAAGRELRPLPMREDHPLLPTSIYGLTKLWQEQLVERYARSTGVDHLILRFQNVYGPGQALRNPYTGIMGVFVNATVQGLPLELFEDGNITRDFVFVDDAAEALVAAVLHPAPLRTVVNCGSGHATTLWELVRQIEHVTGRTARAACSGRYRIGDIRHAVADTHRYAEVFGPWEPTGLQAGLREYMKWYETQPPVELQLVQNSLKEMERQGLLRGK